MADWPERIEEKLDNVLKLLKKPGGGGTQDPPDNDNDNDDNNPPEPPDYEEPDENEEPDEEPDGGDEEPPPTGGQHPSDILDLSKWTIMLPTGKQGDPDNEYVIGRSIANTLFVGPARGVVFRAKANGFHSPNSNYARCEARQMADDDWTKAAWSSSGDHSLECVLSLDASHLVTRKRLNGMQIHDGGDDVCQIMRHETQGLGFMHKDGKEFIPIDPGYVDGTKFTCKIHVKSNKIMVYYNGELKVQVDKSGTGWYWKFGCYNQSGGAKKEFPEPDSAYGEVIVYSYTMTGGAS